MRTIRVKIKADDYYELEDYRDAIANGDIDLLSANDGWDFEVISKKEVDELVSFISKILDDWVEEFGTDGKGGKMDIDVPDDVGYTLGSFCTDGFLYFVKGNTPSCFEDIAYGGSGYFD